MNLRTANKLLPAVWLLVIITTVTLMVWRITEKGIKIETNILNLLPEHKKDRLTRETIDKYKSKSYKQIIFLVSHAERDSALKYAENITKKISEGPFNLLNSWDNKSEEMKAWFNLYFPYRYQVFSPATEKILESENSSQKLIGRLMHSLYSPAPLLYSGTLEKDPLLLFKSLANSNFGMELPGAEFVDGFPVFSDSAGSHILIPARLSGDPFKEKVQLQVKAFINNLRLTFEKQNNGISIVSTGIVRYAGNAFQSAKTESTLIGIISAAGIVLLLLLVFHSGKYLVYGILPPAVALIFALAVTVFFFDKVHIISLTMGACLTGVCIDYSFHFLAHLFVNDKKHSSIQILKNVLPGITLGMITSMIGYSSFLIAPFPGLKQIAVFTSAGLIASYLTVTLWFPVIFNTAGCPHKNLPVLKLMNIFLKKAGTGLKKHPVLIFSTTVVLSIICVFRGNFNDDIHLLKSKTPGLDREESIIRSYLNYNEMSRFIVVKGKDGQELLQKNGNLSEFLESLKNKGDISSFTSLSTFLPDIEKQKTQNLALRNIITADCSYIISQLSSAGFSEKCIAGLMSAMKSPPDSFLTLQKWLVSPVSAEFRHLVSGTGKDTMSSIMSLNGIRNENKIEDMISNFKFAEYINTTADISNLLENQRKQIIKVICLAYIFIFLILIFRYGIKQAPKIILPPFTAVITSLFILSMMQISLNILHLLSVMLVLGIGIDYTIFFAECKDKKTTTMLAITLSCFTTILSFGLLLFSSNPALKSIGSIIVPGITLSLILSPLAEVNKK